MNIDPLTGNAEDASDYSFSNFYFHPDFLNAKGDPTIKEVFTCKPAIAKQPDDTDRDNPGPPEEKRDDT
jgi:hypothetical protein